MYSDERSLAKRMQDKPFAILGVDTDESLEELQKAIKDNHLTWRSWYDGQGGPIVASWNIDGFPTLFLIDAKGVIRKKYVGPPPDEKAFNKLIDDLVEEAEANAKPTS